jgi:hypothetical protein
MCKCNPQIRTPWCGVGHCIPDGTIGIQPVKDPDINTAIGSELDRIVGSRLRLGRSDHAFRQWAQGAGNGGIDEVATYEVWFNGKRRNHYFDLNLCTFGRDAWLARAALDAGLPVSKQGEPTDEMVERANKALFAATGLSLSKSYMHTALAAAGVVSNVPNGLFALLEEMTKHHEEQNSVLMANMEKLKAMLPAQPEAKP